MCVRARMHVHLVVCDSVATWTAAHQAPLFTEFSRQEYWNGLPFPTRGDLPDLGTEPASLPSPALAGRFLTAVPSGKPLFFFTFRLIIIVFSFHSYSILSTSSSCWMCFLLF